MDVLPGAVARRIRWLRRTITSHSGLCAFVLIGTLTLILARQYGVSIQPLAELPSLNFEYYELNFLHLQDYVENMSSNLSCCIPSGISEGFAPKRQLQYSRWDDEPTDYTYIKKPHFHLLIPADTSTLSYQNRQSTMNLCRTLLSAGILNYPTTLYTRGR